MTKKVRPTLEQRRAHYELERRLSDKLRNSTKSERRNLYTEVYDEIYTKVPYLLPEQVEISHQKLTSDLKMIRPYVSKDTSYLEVGPGNCIFAFAIAPFVKKVLAVDVSPEVTKNSNPPANFELVISDGTSIPVPADSVDFAYSNQLMEHLHPDDAKEQLENIYRALKSGGTYLCRTPNRLSGPHDISGYFDDVATGFHLKEYTIEDLIKLMKEVGFKKFELIIGAHSAFFKTNPLWVIIIEKMLLNLPITIRRRFGRFFPIRLVLGIKLLATK